MAINELDLLQQTIERSNEQGLVMSKIITEMRKLKNDTETLVLEVRDEFEEFKKTIPLSGPEADKLNSLARKKAHELTELYFGRKVSEELFSAKYGHLISGVYRSIKDKFEVSKYNQVRHRQAEYAFEYTQQITFEDLKTGYLRMTDKQLEISEKHNDEIPTDFRGAHINHLKFVEFET